MNFEQSANLEQKQVQKLSQHQRQSLELLHCPVLELEQFLANELKVNPMLEELEPLSEPQNTEDGQEESQCTVELDEWGDEVDIPDPERLRRSEEQPDYLLNRPAPGPTLAEQLDTEIITSGCSARTAELAMEIAALLDDTGYLKTPLADLAMTCNADMQELEEALKLIQSFDPPGIGARDLAECLRLQLERKGKLTPLLEEIISGGLEDIENNRLPQLARRLGVAMDELLAALAELRKLDPTPGVRSGGSSSAAVVELEIVRQIDGEYLVRLTREQPMRLGVSSRYADLLRDPALSAEDRAYLEEKLAAARELIKGLEKRKSTLLRLGEVIAVHQKDFLDRGPEYLHGFTMKQAADAIGVHETTVSRAVDGKYVATPHGVFKLKYFFSGAYSSTAGGGSDISANAVKERLRELIRREDPHSPLSDEKLSELLSAEGVSVARRTVAKYREAMNIPSAGKRKKY